MQDYSDAGQFEGETITGGLLDGFSVNTGYDSLKRKNAFTVSRGGSLLASTGWSYDALSRMESVTQGNDAVAYAYHPNSSLPATFAFKRGEANVLTTSKAFDTLGRLDVLTHTPSAGVLIVFDYAYNDAGLRERITSVDNSFWTMAYNDRAELTSGVRKAADQTPLPGQAFGYQFDGIGNRLTTSVDGRVSTYVPNAVNEYESRTVPGYFNILGEAASDSTVMVNGSPAERLGKYFRAELTADNTTAPVQATATTVATRATETASVVTRRFIPETPEILTHDDDGNLTADGRWNNVWDAENRLVEQTATASSVAAGARNLKLVYAYDYAGRRIKKTVSERNGTNWTGKYSLNFLYDGWNLVAEVAANGGPVLRSYAWGADLSGGDAAGGIGGLAFIHYHLENKTLATVSDAQGNTAALYEMENGQIEGRYEYGPFGEPLRASGRFAEVNPFRFSTKYEDPETGWLYYGYRFYNPETGRWLSRDPIGEAGGINLYGYVSNNPINTVDLLGLYFEGTFDRVARTLTLVDKDPGGKTYVLQGVVSGNGGTENDPTLEYLSRAAGNSSTDGPLPGGLYRVGTPQERRDHILDPLGNATWFPLYGPDGKGGYSHSSIPVADPRSRKIIIRGFFFLHVGNESDGCMSVPSTVPNSNYSGYPNSADFSAVEKMIQGTSNIQLPNSKGNMQSYKGTIFVK